MDAMQSALAMGDISQRQQLHKLLSELLINVSDQLFENRDIYVDGYRFVNCSFVNCRLCILRGTFEFHHCFARETKRMWNEDAIKCVQLYTLWEPHWRADKVFAPVIHADGSFSIAKGASV
jgi:hypothetical protein